MDHQTKKMRQMVNQNADYFKNLVVINRRLDTLLKESPDVASNYRLPELQEAKTESLEEWVGREFAPKNTGRNGFALEEVSDIPGESIEGWVNRQKIKPKLRSNPTVIDHIEEWLMNEAKKDLYAQIDSDLASSKELNSQNIRQLGLTLLSLADKLDKFYSPSS